MKKPNRIKPDTVIIGGAHTGLSALAIEQILKAKQEPVLVVEGAKKKLGEPEPFMYSARPTDLIHPADLSAPRKNQGWRAKPRQKTRKKNNRKKNKKRKKARNGKR